MTIREAEKAVEHLTEEEIRQLAQEHHAAQHETARKGFPYWHPKKPAAMKAELGDRYEIATAAEYVACFRRDLSRSRPGM